LRFAYYYLCNVEEFGFKLIPDKRRSNNRIIENLLMMRRKSNLSDDIFLMVDFDNRVCFSFGFIRDLLDNSFVSLFGRDILGDRCSLNREIVEFLADKFSFRIESVDIREIVSSAVSEVKL